MIKKGDEFGSLRAPTVATYTYSLPPSYFVLSMQQHIGSILKLQIDDSQIVSSSYDDTILIWDFLDVPDHLTYPQLECKIKLKPHIIRQHKDFVSSS